MTDDTHGQKFIEQAEALEKTIMTLTDEIDSVTTSADILPKVKHTSSDIGKAYFALTDLHKKLDAATKKLYHAKNAYDKAIIPKHMEENGLSGFKVPEIARSFSVNQKMSASFLDKEKGYQWLRDQGQGDIITETVNAGTLSAFCRDMILNQGMEPPEDIIKVNTYEATSMTRYNPK